MRFEFTPQSQAGFRRGLAATAQRLNKSILDLLRQTAVYYAQAARKRTPGPWYNSLKKTRTFREVRKLTEQEQAKFLEAGPLEKWPEYGVEVYVGTQPNKIAKLFPSSSRRPAIARITYRGAAQLSWSAMLKKMFKTEAPPPTTANFANVLTNGASVQQGHSGAFRPFIATENRLGYIARLRPGIVAESLLVAQNRFANAYIRKIGKDLEAEFKK